MKQHFDWGSLIIIVVTFLLFVLALFFKGFTKDLLLEAGVLLVSIKLIIMAYRNSVANRTLLSELDEIKKMMRGSSEQE